MKRVYEAGEVLFREGEPSLSAYVVHSGQVELSKNGSRGPVRIAMLGRGEILGEMGVLDKSPRSATATAATDLTVEVLPRSEFLHQIETRPGMALKIMVKLAERLRATDAMLVALSAEHGVELPVVEADAPPERRPGLLGGLLRGLFGGRRRTAVAAEPPALRAGPLVVLVASVAGDYDGGPVLRGVLDSLVDLPSVTVRHLGQSVAGAGPAEDDVEAAAAVPGEPSAETLAHAQRLLARGGGDLLVWGEVEADGGRLVRIHFLPATVSEDRPGAVTSAMPLVLPIEIAGAWAWLLRVTVLAALDPRTEAHVEALRTALGEAIGQANVEGAQAGMGAADQAWGLIAYGNAAAAKANFEHDGQAFDVAISAYRKALRFLGGPGSRAFGLANRLLGMAFQATAERLDDLDMMERATDAYRAACQSITREEAPREWALLQNRLGLLLYRLDLRTGKSEPLREALSAFQGALSVITRAEDPLRWSEIMNNLAQALQIYGDHVRNVELIQRAIEASRAALDVRARETVPLLWAASQNTLGGALFLLARHANDSELLRQAAEAFRAALETYEMHGQARMAGVAEKNLARAESQYNSQRRRKVARPLWAEESEPVAEPPAPQPPRARRDDADEE